MNTFSTLVLVHQCRGRCRWRYTLADSTPLDEPGMVLAIENLPGVKQARINPRARALVVEYAADLDAAAQLQADILQVTPTPRANSTSRQPDANASLRGVLFNLCSLGAVSFLPAPLRLPLSLLACWPAGLLASVAPCLD